MYHGKDQTGPVAILPKVLICLPITGLLIGLCWIRTLKNPASLKWDRWGFGEWLINYQGGFVRRALVGQWIFEHTRGASAVVLVNELVFANFAALCILLLCLIAFSRPITWIMAVLMLLAPGGVYTAVAANELFYRKEMIFHVHLAAIGLCFLLARRAPSAVAARILDVLALLVSIVGSMILPFIHEGFLFISGVPTAVFVYWITSKRSPRVGRAFALGYLGTITVLFVALAVFKGNTMTERAVWASLNPADRATIGVGDAANGAIKMLGASLWDGIKMAASVPLSGGAWNWIFAILASIAYLMMITYAQPGDRAEVRARIGWTFTLYALCLVGSAPLFALGLDWGRWIAGINVSMIIILCAGEFREPTPVTITVSPEWISRVPAPALLSIMALFGLSYKLPEYNISQGNAFKFLISSKSTGDTADSAFSPSPRRLKHSLAWNYSRASSGFRRLPNSLASLSVENCVYCVGSDPK